MSQRSSRRSAAQRRLQHLSRIQSSVHRQINHQSPCRQLQFEPLEERRLLSITVTTLEDSVDLNDGVTSLREAIFAANTVAGADTIEFAPNLTAAGPATVLLTHGELQITDALSLVGPGAELLTVDASGNDPTPEQSNGDGSGVFYVRRADSQSFARLGISFRGITVTGSDNRSQAAIQDFGNAIAVERCIIRGNSSPQPTFPSPAGIGGAFETTIRDSLIEGNVGHGVKSGNVVLTNSIVRNNTGAGIVGIYGDMTIKDSTISGNLDGGVRLERGQYGREHTLTLRGSTISQNESFGQRGPLLGNYGGGAFAIGDVVVNACTINGNSAEHGGGIAATGTVRITESVVSDNTALGATISGHIVGGAGGGILAIEISLFQSTIHHNSAANGGGVFLGYPGGDGFESGRPLTIFRSAIHDNSATAKGGGVFSTQGTIVADQSTFNGNKADLDGGAIYSDRRTLGAASVTLRQSTVSGNAATGSGGGVWSRQGIDAQQTTITANEANVFGGGLFVYAGSLTMANTIVAGNTAFGGGPDLTGLAAAEIGAHYSLIGTNAGTRFLPAAVGSPDSNGNVIGSQFIVSPGLLPLADNGGFELPDGSRILTHASWDGSAVINTGDPAAVAGQGRVPLNDQRGAPFARVFGGRIDIGAMESIPIGLLPGDFNLDGAVDAADFSRWQDSLGALVPAGTGADGNGDGKVDQLDYEVWKSNFGSRVNELPALTAGNGALPMRAIERGGAAFESSLAQPNLEAADRTSRPLRGSKVRILPQASTACRDTLLAYWQGPNRRRIDRSTMHIDEASIESSAAGDANFKDSAFQSLDRFLLQLR